ncbi:MAG TPA: helix-turn-helix transcriptional regulator [Xanthomonadaceae bacterium]|nr:helix-turn-helix transcriptional regulator [Xanthomonadaceae bacterium]
MPNIASVLKEEIARIARKELRAHVEPLRKQVAAQRREIAALKRQGVELERAMKQLGRRAATAAAGKAAVPRGKPVRFQARGLRSLRQRLGLSAEDFGKLAGVSAQTIYNWEAEKTLPRARQIETLAQLRGLGKREALARLGAARGAPARRGRSRPKG